MKFLKGLLLLFALLILGVNLYVTAVVVLLYYIVFHNNTLAPRITKEDMENRPVK